jgi:hypothetical protein
MDVLTSTHNNVHYISPKPTGITCPFQPSFQSESMYDHSFLVGVQKSTFSYLLSSGVL